MQFIQLFNVIAAARSHQALFVQRNPIAAQIWKDTVDVDYKQACIIIDAS